MLGAAELLHAVAAAIWVGGMFFAYMVLRPVAASQLDPPQRLPVWSAVFGLFFPWVWAAIVAILATGFWIIVGFYGGMAKVGFHVHLMLLLGIVMMLIFMHVNFAPYRRLKKAVATQDWQAGGKALSQIRVLVGINTLIGIVTIALGAGGRHLVAG